MALGLLRAASLVLAALGAWRWLEKPGPSVRYQPAPDAGVEATQRSLLERLGYLAGYRDARGAGGVTVHERGAVNPGLNLCVSGHAPVALLFDMEGRVLHEWRLPFAEAFPDADPELAESEGARFWRRAHLFPDGGLLAVFDYAGLVRLDRDSRLLWAVPGSFHHDVAVEGGRIHALRDEERSLPRIRPTPVREDFAVVLDDDGRELERLSLLEAIESSPHAGLLDGLPEHADIFHTNTIQVLDGSQAGRSPAFARGNLLLSMRHLNALVVVDTTSGVAVWADADRWVWQHEPVLLPGGNLLLFDNLGRDGRSRVLEFDPLTHRRAWSWHGDADLDLFSEGMGSVQRLPNGNTLVVESTTGRVFEVTPEGVVVWRYENPERAGPGGELVAVLPDCLRIDAGAVEAWLRPPR